MEKLKHNTSSKKIKTQQLNKDENKYHCVWIVRWLV